MKTKADEKTERTAHELAPDAVRDSDLEQTRGGATNDYLNLTNLSSVYRDVRRPIATAAHNDRLGLSSNLPEVDSIMDHFGPIDDRLTDLNIDPRMGDDDGVGVGKGPVITWTKKF
ncbi:MAG: hypothetical protein ABW217_01320 [Polyangiaceae bacterium]